MLGLADSNDPTPPIRLGTGIGLRSLLGPLVGLGWTVYGAIRIGSSFWDGLLFLVGGAVFLVIGALRAVVWRRSLRASRRPDRGSDGGTADRP
jgi:membrane protein implicated in regulation of membrane protease activity